MPLMEIKYITIYCEHVEFIEHLFMNIFHRNVFC
uniref:Uncharacterized protein n=1 Tax=Anguilla anguilla TaxID=7936 RepID=A0A0E9VGB1_ANGAN